MDRRQFKSLQIWATGVMVCTVVKEKSSYTLNYLLILGVFELLFTFFT